MKYISSSHWMAPLAVAALCSYLPQKVNAQANAFFWGYEGTGTAISTPNINGTDNPQITDAHYLEIGGTNLSDSQQVRWERLMSSGYLYGGTTMLVRGRDVSEDWSPNWSTPATEATIESSRFVVIDVNAISLPYFYKQTGNAGPHPNELLRGNQNIIALSDDTAIFWDSDQTLSVYALAGGILADYSWTTLNGGTFNNMTLSLSLLGSSFIGAEQGQLAFLTGPSQIDFYSLIDGNYLRSADYSQVTTGPLADYTLADIIDGKVENWTYIGIDGLIPGPLIGGFAPIPEPSMALWVLGGIGLFAFRGKLRAWKNRA